MTGPRTSRLRLALAAPAVAAVAAAAVLAGAGCGPPPPQAPLPQAKLLDRATSGISTTCGLTYQLTAFPGANRLDLIVLEATGGYALAPAVAFSEAELPFAIVFPRRVRQFALGLGMNAKTDDIDAHVIAYYGRTAGIKSVPLKSRELRELEALTTRRSQLIEMRLSEQNRLDKACWSAGTNRILRPG